MLPKPQEASLSDRLNMADSKQLPPNTNLPRLPKVHGSLPKLPTFGKKANAAEVPALSSQATQLPGAPIPDIEKDGSATEAFSQPTKEAIARGIAELNAQRDAASGISSALNAVSSLESGTPSLSLSLASPNDDPMDWMPLNSSPQSAMPLSSPNLADSPSLNDLPSFGMASEPAPSVEETPASEPVAETPQTPVAQAEIAPTPNPAPTPDPAPQPEPEHAPSEPEFGGAAAENDDFQYEDEPIEDLGEKTVMLSEMDDEIDEENQKTQINMSAMDYDPLSGKLVVESGKASQREYILVREKTAIGRVADNDITISDISMSRHHAEISKFREGFRLRDLDSANGTLLNGYRIRVAQLRNGDIIEIGSVRFRFEQSGGDPSELWKGEPKIEYHPNQKNTHPASSAPLSSPPVVTPSAPNNPPQPVQPQQPPQMEAMLQRQGGGLAAPQWGPSPMTSPYMMGFAPNALRNINTTPTWANVVLGVLVFIFIASTAFGIYTWYQASQHENAIAEREAIVNDIHTAVTNGINAYIDKRFDNARAEFMNAQKLGQDGVITDKTFFDNYINLINKEEDYNERILEISKSLRSPNSSETLEEYIQFIDTINPASVVAVTARRTKENVTSAYIKQLMKEIRADVDNREFVAARTKLAKLSAYSDAANNVKTLSKLISDREKTVQ